ncbi:hypothetical protein [Cryptosporangium minutisporangium]|uniref:Histidine kinase/HSP90-like ATPase domain-containing protein n=1 Tax=Cryptosporangium minutisporangium TaxID=113569 RepID=A0ABP6SSU2_9ACTN
MGSLWITLSGAVASSTAVEAVRSYVDGTLPPASAVDVTAIVAEVAEQVIGPTARGGELILSCRDGMLLIEILSDGPPPAPMNTRRSASACTWGSHRVSGGTVTWIQVPLAGVDSPDRV